MIDVSVSPVEGGPETTKIDGGFTSTSLRKSYDDDEQVITCVAMVANEIDAHGDMFLPSAVKMAAHNFLSRYNLEKSIGKQHDPDAEIDADLIGSFYTEEAISFSGLEAPPESWISQIRINDSETWTEVKKAERTGVSIKGPAKGWVVDEQVEKSIGVMLEKAKAHDSKYTKPKRVFAEADPTDLDIVDAGANLHLLVWKAKTQMAEKKTETKETIATPVVKGLAASETPSTETAASPTEVVKSEAAPAIAETPATPPVNVLDELAKSVSLAKALQGLDIAKLSADIATLQSAVGDGVAPAPAKPEPEAVDVTKMIAAEVAKAVAPLMTDNQKLRTEIEELSKAKVAPASGVDDDSELGEKTETEVAKAKFPGNKIDVDGQLSKIFSSATVRRG